jgi:hypothetical protein
MARHSVDSASAVAGGKNSNETANGRGMAADVMA